MTRVAWSRTTANLRDHHPAPMAFEQEDAEFFFRSLIWRLNAGCAMFRRSAALLRLRSATWIKHAYPVNTDTHYI